MEDQEEQVVDVILQEHLELVEVAVEDHLEILGVMVAVV